MRAKKTISSYAVLAQYFQRQIWRIDVFIIIDMIFDILYVKGPKGEECNLLNVKLKDRKMVLKRVIKNIKQKFEVVTGHETTNVDDIFREFDKAMMRNEEGIIIKQLDSIYLPNDRGTSWIKLKGEYMEGMTDTLDLLIIGGYFGEGRVRIGVQNHDIELAFSNFMYRWEIGQSIWHISFWESRNQSTKKTQKNQFFFLSVKSERVTQLMSSKNSEMCWEPDGKNTIRKWSQAITRVGTRLRVKYQMCMTSFSWLLFLLIIPLSSFVDSPVNSVILEVKAAEIIRANTFIPGYTLRFPRVVKIRYDKDWNECLDEPDLVKMIDQISQTKGLKRIKGGEGDEEEEEEDGEGEEQEPKEKKKKAGGGPPARQLYVMPQFQDTDTSHVNPNRWMCLLIKLAYHNNRLRSFQVCLKAVNFLSSMSTRTMSQRDTWKSR